MLVWELWETWPKVRFRRGPELGNFLSFREEVVQFTPPLVITPDSSETLSLGSSSLNLRHRDVRVQWGKKTEKTSMRRNPLCVPYGGIYISNNPNNGYILNNAPAKSPLLCKQH